MRSLLFWHWAALGASSVGHFGVPRAWQLNRVALAQLGAKTMTYVMTKPCPVCRQQLTKKRPTETVHCACGKHIWQANPSAISLNARCGSVARLERAPVGSYRQQERCCCEPPSGSFAPRYLKIESCFSKRQGWTRRRG